MFESKIQKAAQQSLHVTMMDKLGFGPDVWAGVMTIKYATVLSVLDGAGQTFEEASWGAVEETLDFPSCIVESGDFERLQVRINGSNLAQSTSFELPDEFEGDVVAYAIGYFNAASGDEPVFIQSFAQCKTMRVGDTFKCDHAFGQPHEVKRTVPNGGLLTFNSPITFEAS